MSIAYPIGCPIALDRGNPNRPRIARPVPSRPHVNLAIHGQVQGINSRPVDNAAAGSTQHRRTWMALREIGGGC